MMPPQMGQIGKRAVVKETRTCRVWATVPEISAREPFIPGVDGCRTLRDLRCLHMLTADQSGESRCLIHARGQVDPLWGGVGRIRGGPSHGGRPADHVTRA